MLTKLTLRNFKKFEEVSVELGKSVVLIGPNNSGKTSALQALALWEHGLHRWAEKRMGKLGGLGGGRRPGIAINRRELIALPIPSANLLWRDLHVRSIDRSSGKQKTQNVRIEIIVEGITEDRPWQCGLEFDYANEESFFCRPLRLNEQEDPQRMEVPGESLYSRVAFLPPMSGLAEREYFKQTGEIGVLIGQGLTAQVLRNLCYRVCWPDPNQTAPSADWIALTDHIQRLFGIRLRTPEFFPERAEITMQYEEKGSGIRLDISSSGRGLQQTLLILTHLYSNPNTILLLDEPDAHLEVLRQRQTYQLINDIAESKGAQVIAASHSEVVLNEAADRGTIVSFVGKPRTLGEQPTQIRKALTDIGWDQYFQAEQTGWVLYVEDSTDLAILQAFARLLDNSAAVEALERPFLHAVATNLPQRARDHFNGLQAAKPELIGIAIFDRLERALQPTNALNELCWERREIENYFCTNDVLRAWAVHDIVDDLFGEAEKGKRLAAMDTAIAEVTKLLEIDEKSPWSPDVKATDEVLDRVFRLFFKEMSLPVVFRKRDYHRLVQFMRPEQVAPEVREKLDAIVATAHKAVSA